jgi:hypothetical protein
MSEPFSLSSRYYVPAYWWVATELARRNPQLELIETYPLDNFYDCLTLHGESSLGLVHIDLNRLGSVHVHPDHIGLMSGAEIAASDDAHWAVKEIERVAGLAPNETAPSSGARIITLRLMARVVNYLVNDRATWTLRMLSPNGYGWSFALFPDEDILAGKTTPMPDVFPTERQYRSFLIETGMPEDFQEGRFWGLQCDERTVAVFDTKGVVYTKQARTVLKSLYARTNRNLTQTMAVALADVLP